MFVNLSLRRRRGHEEAFGNETDLNAERAKERKIANEGDYAVNKPDRRSDPEEVFGEEVDLNAERAKRKETGDDEVSKPNRRRGHEEAFGEDVDLNTERAKKRRTEAEKQASIPIEEAVGEDDLHRRSSSPAVAYETSIRADTPTASSETSEDSEDSEGSEFYSQNSLVSVLEKLYAQKPSRPVLFQCNWCNRKPFESQDALSQHMEDKHR